MSGELKLLGIPGTLRKGSYNAGLLRSAAASAPPGVAVEIIHLGDVPLYNADVEAVGDPEPVVRLKNAIESADALLIACGEYNYSIPGVLKNALDWASRPPQLALNAKPTAIMGASPSGFGTARGQLVVRQTLSNPGCLVLPKPELWVSSAHDHFDEDGNLTDDEIAQKVTALVEALVAWTERLS